MRTIKTSCIFLPIAACVCIGGCGLIMGDPAFSGMPAQSNGRINVSEDTGTTTLQAEVMSFADTYISLTAQAADNLAVLDQSARRRALATQLKLQGAEAVVEMATGPNPKVAMLDIAVMVTIQKQVWQDYWVKTHFKDDGFNYTDAIERLHNDIWNIVSARIDAQSVQDLKILAKEIRDQHITQVFTANLRASKLAQEVADGKPVVRTSPSLLTAFGLDPLAGLSPAVAEVTKARLLAERVFFYSQKVPMLAGWRTELVLARSLATPEATDTLKNLDSAVTSVGKISQLAEGLDAMIAKQREEAFKQSQALLDVESTRVADLVAKERTALLDGVGKEREALLRGFDEREAQARAVLGDLKATIAAADDLSKNSKLLIDAVTKLTAADPNAPPSQPGRPFDIREYQSTLTTATTTLKELNQTIKTAQDLTTSPQIAQAQNAIATTADDLERRAFKIIILAAIALGVSLFVSLCGVAVVKRMLLPRTA